MKDEDPVLAAILAKLGGDDDWDETLQMGMIYKQIGLKRYFIKDLEQFQSNTRLETHKESITSSSSDVQMQKDSELEQLTICGDKGPQIKIEHPDFIEYKALVKVLASGKSALEKLQCTAQDFLSRLDMSQSKDKSLTMKYTLFKTSVGNLNTFMSDLRNMVVAASFAAHDDPKMKDMIKDADTMKQKILIHQSGLKEAMNTYRPLLLG